MNTRLRTIIAFLLLSAYGYTQTIEEIDAIFEEVNDPSRPAIAAFVMHKGEVVYKKAFGRQHLDYDAPATTETKFQLAGLSKHFTAFAIFLLEEEGKLSFDDDIRKHIPELPDYGEVVTVKHLLAQSSGLRGYWPLRPLTGQHYSDVFSHDQAMKLISRQKELDFSPGSDYSYTNTGQTVLAEIIERISGKSFTTFTKERLFDPLGMGDTFFKTSSSRYIPNLAESYQANEEGYDLAPISFEIVGPTNLYSTVEDLIKWEMNLLNPKVGTTEMIAQMNTPVLLDDGSKLNTTFGIVTQGQQILHKERGVWNIYQMGTLGGYSVSIFKFMEQDFTVMVMSSGMSYSGYLGMRTAYLYLDEHFTEPEVVDFESLKTKKLSAKRLQKHEGFYWDWKASSSRSIELKDDTLRYVRGPGSESALLPLSDNQFQMVAGGDEKIYVSFKEIDGQKRMEFSVQESDPIVFTKYRPVEYRTEELDQFTGTFYSEELSTVYSFELKDEILTATHARNTDVSFTPVATDQFDASAWYFGAITYERNAQNEITGFWVVMDDVRKLWFEKIG